MAAQSVLFLPKNDEQDINNAESPDDDAVNNQKCAKIEGSNFLFSKPEKTRGYAKKKCHFSKCPWTKSK
jgi:hypothetical protein